MKCAKSEYTVHDTYVIKVRVGVYAKNNNCNDNILQIHMKMIQGIMP